MRSAGQSTSTRLFGEEPNRSSRAMALLPRPGVLNRRLGLATAAYSGCPTRPARLPPRPMTASGSTAPASSGT
jgi:hypothetical protein